MTPDEAFDVFVVGGGPAGVTAALLAAELGARVALVERGRLGGTCTNDGCVPTRALARAARLIRDENDLGRLTARPVQVFIDRRFYRAKYDAEQALAQFAAAAREEVDVDRLAGALLSVVEETMRPERVSLWLKPATSNRWQQKK